MEAQERQVVIEQLASDSEARLLELVEFSRPDSGAVAVSRDAGAVVDR